MKIKHFFALLCVPILFYAQEYRGVVIDKVTSLPIGNAKVTLLETNQQTTTDIDGTFSIAVSTREALTLQVDKEGYMFEDLRNLIPSSDLSIILRSKIKSAATLRWENYLQSCSNYNSPNIPSDVRWNMEWTQQNITGDFAPNTASSFTRRDPTAVIQHNGKYYVWYTRKVSQVSPIPWFSNPNLDGSINVFPWDNADVWYATSTDGVNWDEQGPAAERGDRGNYDDQSVFTPEIFVHENKFYLVYQTVQFPYIERVKNTVGMSVSDSPDGPWVKLAAPILRPTDNGEWSLGSNSRIDVEKKGDFDSHKVHDPCLLFFNNKFYLYYKGERMGEERFCGQREIRWGVAIADNPTGPYVKSEYNPITTSGHEVAVWNYNGGIAIIQKLDGPERGSVQFAADGVNFEMVGTANNVPDALGLYRPGGEVTNARNGATWGLAHRYDWSYPGGANYLVRFDIVPVAIPVDPPSNNALVIEAEDFITTENEIGNTPGGYNGVNRTANGVNFVNSQDWMDFTVNVPAAGDYELIYNISTPSDNAAVEFIVADSVLATTPVPNNNGWDNYTLLKHGTIISLTEGTQTIRIRASGSNEWQWNLDKLYLDPIADLSSEIFLQVGKEIHMYPNPTKDIIYFENISAQVGYTIYNLNGVDVQQGKISSEHFIDIYNLSVGAYIVKLHLKEGEVSKMIIKE